MLAIVVEMYALQISYCWWCSTGSRLVLFYQTRDLLVPEPTSVKSPTLACRPAAERAPQFRDFGPGAVAWQVPTIRDYPLSVGSFWPIQLNLPGLVVPSVLGLWARIVRVSLIAQDEGTLVGNEY